MNKQVIWMKVFSVVYVAKELIFLDESDFFFFFIFAYFSILLKIFKSFKNIDSSEWVIFLKFFLLLLFLFFIIYYKFSFICTFLCMFIVTKKIWNVYCFLEKNWSIVFGVIICNFYVDMHFFTYAKILWQKKRAELKQCTQTPKAVACGCRGANANPTVTLSVNFMWCSRINWSSLHRSTVIMKNKLIASTSFKLANFK